jgi:hypothetical protein
MTNLPMLPRLPRLSSLNWPFPVVNGKRLPFVARPKHQYPLTYEVARW